MSRVFRGAAHRNQADPAMVAAMSTARVDLVCEGGGVRGIGLVGAVDALAAAGYGFPASRVPARARSSRRWWRRCRPPVNR